MEARLEELAHRLQTCRRKGHKLTLDCILESARILSEAKTLARRGFGKWLREKGHMDPSTARRHLRVAEFVRGNRALTPEIAKLGVAKVYALSTLELDTARDYLTGKIRLSKPLELISDVQFRKEFRERHPQAPKRRNREHVFLRIYSALIRLEQSLTGTGRALAKLTPVQRRRIAERLQAVVRAATGVRIVA